MGKSINWLTSQGGRQLLLDAALEAIRVADESSSRHNRVLQARNYHTATVYLEVLMSFNALSAGDHDVHSCVSRGGVLGPFRRVPAGVTLIESRGALARDLGNTHCVDFLRYL